MKKSLTTNEITMGHVLSELVRIIQQREEGKLDKKNKEGVCPPFQIVEQANKQDKESSISN